MENPEFLKTLYDSLSEEDEKTSSHKELSNTNIGKKKITKKKEKTRMK